MQNASMHSAVAGLQSRAPPRARFRSNPVKVRVPRQRRQRVLSCAPPFNDRRAAHQSARQLKYEGCALPHLMDHVPHARALSGSQMANFVLHGLSGAGSCCGAPEGGVGILVCLHISVVPECPSHPRHPVPRSAEQTDCLCDAGALVRHADLLGAVPAYTNAVRCSTC